MERSAFTIWVICKYGSPSKYRFSSKPYRLAQYLSEHEVNTYLISSDSNHVAAYPETKKRYNWENEGNLKHLWIKTLKYSRNASIRRILSWFSFEWHLNRFPLNQLDKPDVVLVSSLSLLSVLTGLRIRRKYKCKLIFEVRDIHPLTLTEELGVSKYHPFVKWLQSIEKTGYQKYDLIVGTMPNLVGHVNNILGEKKDVFFSPLGIKEYWDNPVRCSSEIDNLFPSDQSIVIGYAGSMGRTNNLESFVSAIESLKNNSRLSFVIVGNGDLKESYKERLRGYTNVKFGEKIMQTEIPYFLSKCDILYLSTHPSKVWEYGQSMNKLVDYMMAGKPVIASYSGFPSMLNEAKSGVFIQPNSKEEIMDAINAYASLSEAERNELGQKGREWLIAHYSNEIVCQKYLDRINLLLER